MMMIRFNQMLLMLTLYLFSSCVYSTVLANFYIINSDYNKSLVLLDFQGIPVYNFHFLHCPERLILDVSYIITSPYFKNKKIQVNVFHGQLINRMSIDKLLHRQGMRFIFNLDSLSYVDDVFLENVKGVNRLLLVITRQLSILLTKNKEKECFLAPQIYSPEFKKNKNLFISYMDKKSSRNLISSRYPINMCFPIVVAIDAGHGGHDPGAKGHSGLYEKNITIAIAKKFKQLLDQDPMFNPVMIRDGDYFVSVLDRSELARNKGAKVLLSIHANAISKSSKNNVRGSSVWVLSNRGANIEMAHWLANSAKWLNLPGEVNDVLVGSNDDFNQYFRRTILDLQFCHSQKVGYSIASHILRELKNIGILHKYVPEYSNFAILRSLDIPSVLIETGFITHADEEKLLANDCYQEKIACALHKGLRSYFLGYMTCLRNVTGTVLHSNFGIYNKSLYKNFQHKSMSF